MNKWDEMRKEVNDFNLQEELEKEEAHIYRDIEMVIKENRTINIMHCVVTSNVYKP